MVRRVVLIEHGHRPADDRVARWLGARGYALDWRFPFAGDALDAEPGEDVAGTVIYGGPYEVAETAKHPFLAEEARWIERAMARDLPVVGLCQGGQQIAHILGAAVGPLPGVPHEFGYYPVFATPEGRDLMPETLVVAQAHFHGFDLPAGAVLLARGETFPNQAFRHGARTFAFQFHSEVTRAGFRRWQEAPWAPWGKPGVQTRDAQDALAARFDAAQDAWFTGFLDGLFGVTVADAAPATALG